MAASLRLAIGEVQPGVDRRPMLWALLAALKQRGLLTQLFYSRSHFVCSNAAFVVTGQDYRHLDSWLMSPDLCRRIFAHGCNLADAAVVEGSFIDDPLRGSLAPPRFGSASSSNATPPSDAALQFGDMRLAGDSAQHEGASPSGAPWTLGSRRHSAATANGESSLSPGSLESLCRTLELPRIAIVDVRRCELCVAPHLPSGTRAVFLDGVEDECDARRWRETMGVLYGVPVVGWLPRLEFIRNQIAKLRPGETPDVEMCRFLGRQLNQRLDAESLFRAASGASIPSQSPLLDTGRARPLTVAVAYDEVFQCYFPDAFDLLESLGATLRDFSPLRSELLPCDADVLYFGCGPIAAHAADLMSNCCMRESIRRFVQKGGRVYAECGGLAYLAKQFVQPCGQSWAMTGALPIVATQTKYGAEFAPAETTLRQSCWIGQAGDSLRGYLNSHWRIAPVGPIRQCGALADGSTAIVSHQNVVGSLIHLNFAAQADLLPRFFVAPRELPS